MPDLAFGPARRLSTVTKSLLRCGWRHVVGLGLGRLGPGDKPRPGAGPAGRSHHGPLHHGPLHHGPLRHGPPRHGQRQAPATGGVDRDRHNDRLRSLFEWEQRNIDTVRADIIDPMGGTGSFLPPELNDWRPPRSPNARADSPPPVKDNGGWRRGIQH